MHEAVLNRATARSIIDRVATFHGVTAAEMRGLRRERHVAWPRQEACWVLRLRTNLSTPSVGRLLDRDHTTVLTAVAAVERRRLADADYRQRTDALLRQIDRISGEDAGDPDPLVPILRDLSACHTRLTEALTMLEAARADIAIIQHHGGR